MADGGPKRRLVTFVVEPDPDDPADVIGDEPIWHDGEVVGWVTSGGYGHHVRASIALGYVPDGARRRRTGRAAPASRSRSSAGAGRPASSPSRCSTRRVSGCASDRRRGTDAPAAPAVGSSSTGGRSPSSQATRVAVAIVRAGEVPGRGGALCLAGDCGNCLAIVDGVAYVRTCQVAARPGTVVERHPASGKPPLPTVDLGDPTRRTRRAGDRGSRGHVAVAVIGGGDSGRGRPQSDAAPRRARRRRRRSRSSGSIRARRSWPASPAGCSTSTPTRSSSRPARPSSSRSARATTSPGS